jgi:hypothetical protein
MFLFIFNIFFSVGRVLIAMDVVRENLLKFHFNSHIILISLNTYQPLWFIVPQDNKTVLPQDFNPTKKYQKCCYYDEKTGFTY